MKSIARFFFLVAILFLVFTFASTADAQATGIDAPTIAELRQSAPYGTEQRPIVTGLTIDNSDVLVFIDGTFYAEAKVTERPSAVNSFVFQPAQELADGRHRIELVARERTSLVLSPIVLAGIVTVGDIWGDEAEETEEMPVAADERSEAVNDKFIPAPTMVAPNEKTVTGFPKPFITGLTISGTRVHLVIDGVVNGHTGILKDVSGTADFAYKPFLNLAIGQHTVYAVAEDGSGRKSRASKPLNFRIEAPLPAPVLAKAASNNGESLITGNVKNDLDVRVYIGGQPAGKAIVRNHPSGTANFFFRTNTNLKPGDNLIYAAAFDGRGKESRWSGFRTITRPVPAIGTAEAEGTENIVVKPIERDEAESRLTQLLALARLFSVDRPRRLSGLESGYLKDILDGRSGVALTPDQREQLLLLQRQAEAATTTAPLESEKPRATSSIDADLDRILNGATGTRADAGLINEDRQGQSRLNTNLVVFLLFLAAVIVWIFWVNRELIKERRAKGETAGNDQDKLEL